MTVQATGAMSIIVADIDLSSRDDPARSLFTLTLVTGVLMIAAGLLRLGSFLRFVSNSVMTGFISAVGINIVLGQLGDFTGLRRAGRRPDHEDARPARPPRQVDVADPRRRRRDHRRHRLAAAHPARLARAGGRRVVGGSALAAIFGALGQDVALVGDIADVPRSLPLPQVPRASPRCSVSSSRPLRSRSSAWYRVQACRPDSRTVTAASPTRHRTSSGRAPATSLPGLFQGMPVGGSMSASSLVVSAGAKSRSALLFAGGGDGARHHRCSPMRSNGSRCPPWRGSSSSSGSAP